MLRRSIACDDSPVYGAHSYGSPFPHDVIANRLQTRSDVPGCIRDMLPPPFARAPFRRFSAVLPFGSHFHLMRDCFRPPLPHSFDGAELAVTFVPQSGTPQASCIQGCRYSAALLYACRGRLLCGYIHSYSQYPSRQ